MTLDRYSHAIPALEETAAEVVAALVSAATSKTICTDKPSQ
jgi:hypothetical protein